MSAGSRRSEKSTCLLDMQEQVERISGRGHELTVVLVEGPSVVVTRMNEQGPNANVVGNPDGSTNRVDEEAAAESSVPFRLVDRETSEEETRQLSWGTALGEVLWSRSFFNARSCERVIANNPSSPCCHEHPSVPGLVVDPGIPTQPIIQFVGAAPEASYFMRFVERRRCI